MQRLIPVSSKTILWLVAVSGFALFVAAGLYSAVALPGCVACHDQEPFVSGTADAGHPSTECSACHVGAGVVDRVAFGFRVAYHMTLPIIRGEGRDWSVVADGRCLSCHGTVLEQVTSRNGIRIAHVTCSVSSACTDCHAATAHGAAVDWLRVYDMDTCLECHVSESATMCDLCHEGRLESDRITSGIFAITHGAQWQQTHGMGDAFTCTVCHTAANCEKCHGVGLPHTGDFLQGHSEYAVDESARCQTCHEPRFCDDCHGLEMPHSMAFTRDHADAAEKDGSLCLRCHADPDCTECHETHVHPGGAIGSLDPGGGR